MSICWTATFIELLEAEILQLTYPNWDGYDAEPVSSETIAAAIKFIQSLPDGCTVPSWGAEPDGDIVFEWYLDTSNTVSVSVNAHRIAYAAVLNGVESKGTALMGDRIPEVLQELILGI